MRTIYWISLFSLIYFFETKVDADETTPAASGSGAVVNNAVSSSGNAGNNAASGMGSPTGGSVLGTGGDFADIQGKKPLSYAVGPFDFSPMLEVSETYNDNMFFNNANRKASWMTQVQLGLQLELNHGPNHYDLQYGFRSWTWSSSHADDYLDQFAGGKGHVEFTDSNKLDFNANWIASHNLRGTYFTAPGLPYSQLPSPMTFTEYNAGVKYRYGSAGATGNLELVTGVNDLTYDPMAGVNTSSYNKTRYYFTPSFYYRIMPKTQLLAQVDATWYRYHDATSARQLDFDLQRYLIGAQWQATLQTSGTLHLGYMTQQFTTGAPVSCTKSSCSPSTGHTGFTGTLGMGWSPLTYSRFNLNASRNIMATSGYGTSATVSQVSIGWMHEWTSQVNSHLNLGYTYMENRNVNPSITSNHSSQVNNEYYSANVGVDYLFRDWLSFGLDYKFNSLTSSYNVQNYDQNRIMLYVTLNPHAASQTSAPWQFNF